MSVAQPDAFPSANANVSSSSKKVALEKGSVRFAAGRFVLKNRLGGGSFGEIYCGYDNWRQKDVAVKLEGIHNPHLQLNYESKVYRLLHQNTLDVIGIPEMHWYGSEGEFNVLVMDLGGPNLEDLFNYCSRKFSLKTVCMLAEQFLHRIEYVHDKLFVHRDLKPENFVMGVGMRSHHVYLVDFGLAKRYWDPKQKKHCPYREGKPVTGTARYCSLNTHLGVEQSRRDDIESLGYILVYFLKGTLPWQGIRNIDPDQKTTLIGEKKLSTSLEYLCRDEHPTFLKYMKYARALKFEDKPDYDRLRALFHEVMEKEGLRKDWVMDWVEVRAQELAYTSSQSSSNPVLVASSRNGASDASDQTTPLSDAHGMAAGSSPSNPK